MEDPVQIKTMVLCSSRFAYPAIQFLAYHKWLTAVVIPHDCTEVLTDTKTMLAGSQIVIDDVDQISLESKMQKIITENQINLALVATFNYFIPESVFTLPSLGFFNIHPGILPMYRGADPIFHQIKNREKFAGVTIHHITKAADAGDIILLEKVRLLSDDTYGLLAEKLAQLSVQMLVTLFKIIQMGFAVPSRPQNEAKATYYNRQTLQEIAIDWQTMDADTIIALINACNPHNKGASTKLGNKIIRFLHAEKFQQPQNNLYKPGTIISIDDQSLRVGTINSELLEVYFVNVEEGFLTPSGLKKIGLQQGMFFENIFSKN